MKLGKLHIVLGSCSGDGPDPVWVVRAFVNPVRAAQYAIKLNGIVRKDREKDDWFSGQKRMRRLLKQAGDRRVPDRAGWFTEYQVEEHTFDSTKPKEEKSD